MKNLLLVLFVIISFANWTHGQATFDPIANRKKAEERQAIEKAEKEKQEAKLKANKERLLNNLPKPSYEKVANNNFTNIISMYNEDNNPSNNRQVLINKKALQILDEKLKRYVEDYNSYHKITFKSDINNEQSELAIKYYTGATIFKNLNDTVPINYIKYSDIAESERFMYVAYKNIIPEYFLNVYEFHYSGESNLYTDENPKVIKTNTGQIPHYWNDEKYYAYRGGKKIILQNTETKLFYVVNENTIIEEIFIKVPPTAEEIAKEKEKLNKLVTKYKSLIKTAKSKTVVLGTIQRKYLTRGYFDPNKVNTIDKKTYNNTLSELKKIAKELKQIDNEDKNNAAEEKLSMEEIATLSDVNNWNLNYYPID